MLVAAALPCRAAPCHAVPQAAPARPRQRRLGRRGRGPGGGGSSAASGAGASRLRCPGHRRAGGRHRPALPLGKGRLGQARGDGRTRGAGRGRGSCGAAGAPWGGWFGNPGGLVAGQGVALAPGVGDTERTRWGHTEGPLVPCPALCPPWEGAAAGWDGRDGAVLAPVPRPPPPAGASNPEQRPPSPGAGLGGVMLGVTAAPSVPRGDPRVSPAAPAPAPCIRWRSRWTSS